jgi:hypothetical protein
VLDFEPVRCDQGDRWFPWNYGRKARDGRVGMKQFAHEPGLLVLNAVTPTGRIMGSCSLRVGYRHSGYLLSDEEYRYGAAAAGPAYFWPDDESCPWILVLKSFSEELVGLDRGLLFPERADEWAIDSGDVFEVGFSDSAFAEDRCFGYALSPWAMRGVLRPALSMNCLMMLPTKTTRQRRPLLPCSHASLRARLTAGSSTLKQCAPTCRFDASYAP